MDKDNRKYRICFIDYMWYVAEIWHEREHTNLNGRMLLLFCWLFAILVPLGTPLMFRYFSWIVAFVVWMMLCFLPDLFCQLRYTSNLSFCLMVSSFLHNLICRITEFCIIESDLKSNSKTAS